MFFFLYSYQNKYGWTRLMCVSFVVHEVDETVGRRENSQ